MANKILLLVLIIIGYLSFFTSCANIGMPSGGLKDTIPPYIVSSTPANGELNVKDQKIKLTFNEFVLVEGLNEKFITSPPTTKRPIFRTKGKSLIVDLNEKLTPNATYSLDFKDGISDNNEKNPLLNLRLAFSTGPIFDTLRIVGFVKDAFTLEPINNAYILLYRGTSDTLVYTTKPDYVAKTDKQGFFAVTNLPADTFQVFGLNTAGNNLKYTPGVDSIAFYSSRISPSAKFIPAKDTTYNLSDTLVVVGRTRFSPDPLYLLRFGEPYFDLRLDKYLHPTRKRIELTFTQSVSDTFNIEPINFQAKPGWRYTEMSAKSDSVQIWLTDSMDYKKDTLIFKVTYLQQDSLKEFYAKNDTIRLFYTDVIAPEKNKRKERRKIVNENAAIALNTNIKSGFDPFRTLTIESPEPIESFDSCMVALYAKTDSVFKPISFKIIADSLNKRKYSIIYPWKFASNYKIVVDSAAFQTIYCLDSKEIKVEFKTQEEEHYGKIILNVTNVTVPTIIQLLSDDKKENVIQSIPITESGEITFKFLEPQKYMIKALFDRNNNGKWDSGNLKERIPPEEVMYYLSVVKVRSNWDIKDTWALPSQPIFSKKIIDEELEAQKLKDKQKKFKNKSAF